MIGNMKKNSGKNIEKIQVNPIDGNYYITIPEWIINEFSWYEDTDIEFDVESNEIVLREYKND
jgi:bifunctional DNA-binding transcriptional regulator/antitoxin component of YhaV-PrlF toxin-antitoxin module